MGATQRLKHDAGNQKLWEFPGIRGLSPEPSSSNLVRENFGPGNFCEAWAPRSVGSTTRGAKNCGKFPGFAGCLGNLLRPTWSAKIWWTELFAKHGRHAAFEARRGEPERMGNSGIRGLSWDLGCCKVVFGTFFFEGRSAKILEPEISAKHGRHAAFEARRGEPKVVVNSRDSRCVFGTFFAQLGPRKFWKRKFLKSMGTTQRWKQDAGRQKFCKISWLRGSPWDLCCCKVVFGTFFFEGRSAKILEPEISAKHGRHAAFEARRGEPKIVVNSRDSRVVLGTSFVQLGPRKFWRRKFLKSMGATQRFACNAGGRGRRRRDISLRDSCVWGAAGANALSTEEKG